MPEALKPSLTPALNARSGARCPSPSSLARQFCRSTLLEVRGNRPPSINRLSEWQTRAYPALRKMRESGTPVADLLPDTDEFDLDATLAAIRALPN